MEFHTGPRMGTTVGLYYSKSLWPQNAFDCSTVGGNRRYKAFGDTLFDLDVQTYYHICP